MRHLPLICAGTGIVVLPHIEQSVWRFLNRIVVLVVVHGGRLKPAEVQCLFTAHLLANYDNGTSQLLYPPGRTRLNARH
jgi:hypothetical protein